MGVGVGKYALHLVDGNFEHEGDKQEFPCAVCRIEKRDHRALCTMRLGWCPVVFSDSVQYASLRLSPAIALWSKWCGAAIVASECVEMHDQAP